jgi:GAF domain-containing protein
VVAFDDDAERREKAVQNSGVLKRGHDPVLESIVAQTAARYGAQIAGLSIITGRRQILLACFGANLTETPREASFCNIAIQRPGEPLIVPDAVADPRFADLPVVVGAPHVRFYAGVSILDGSGYPLGALCVADRVPRGGRFDTTDLLIRGREIERLLR